MSEPLLAQTILSFENFLSGHGFGAEARSAAQLRGWLDRDGRPTEEGHQLCRALLGQHEQRSVFRNVI
ncbi:MAG: hypothetical protein ACKOED_01895 [Aestuariivirga sp.]|uniref:hypothetical protein n=1 Tax=Aestuariivirga sp. TaxID=2650926 RepID=UPI0038D1BC92